MDSYRLLEVLHKNINDLPSYLTEYGIQSNRDVQRFVDEFKQKIQNIISQTQLEDYNKNQQLRALQLEVDFVKKVYLNNAVRVRECDRYKALYDDILQQIEFYKSEYTRMRDSKNANEVQSSKLAEMENQTMFYESKIKEMTTELQNSEGLSTKYQTAEIDLNTAKRYLRLILRMIYPNETDEDLNSMYNKIRTYIENTQNYMQTISELRETIAQLNGKIDEANNDAEEHVKTVIGRVLDRCNAHIEDIKQSIVTYNRETENVPKDLYTELLTRLTGYFDKDSETFNEEPAWDSSGDIFINDNDGDYPIDNDVNYDETPLTCKTPSTNIVDDMFNDSKNENDDYKVNDEIVDDYIDDAFAKIGSDYIPPTPGRDYTPNANDKVVKEKNVSRKIKSKNRSKLRTLNSPIKTKNDTV